METTGIGGGIMLAIAAVLWMAYLLPTWFRRREYLSTERNAVRLQQTVRVLAETAEVPEVVRAGLRMPRAAASDQSTYVAQAVPTGVAGRQVPERQLARRPVNRVPRARRLRRARAATSVVMLVSIVIVTVQASLMVNAGAVPGSWLVLGVASLAALGSLNLLQRLARAGRAQRAVGVPVQRRAESLFEVDEVVREDAAGWTPVPLPKPLYLSRPAPRQVFATESAAELQAAAAASERVLREAQQSPEVVPISRPAASAAANARAAEPVRPTGSSRGAAAEQGTGESRFARMGIVDPAELSGPDIDAALKRRRVAG